MLGQTNRTPTEPTLIFFKRMVLLLSLTYAMLESLYLQGTLSFQPSSLFDWSHTSTVGYIIKTWILSFIIPYKAVSWDMIWNFALLALLYAPIASFVISYCGNAAFFRRWFFYAYLAAANMMFWGHFFKSPYEPFSLFLILSYWITVFWIIMLTTTGREPNAFLVIPVSTQWIFLIATYFCIIAPFLYNGMATAITSVIVGCVAYLDAIVCWNLSLRIEGLAHFEERVKGYAHHLRRFFQWHVMKHIRYMTQKLSQWTKKK